MNGATATLSHNVHSTIDHNWFSFKNRTTGALADSVSSRHSGGSLGISLNGNEGTAQGRMLRDDVGQYHVTMF